MSRLVPALPSFEMGFDSVTQSFFDITFCYFPITFRPPPDDPYGITSEQLKEKLLYVLYVICPLAT